MLRRPFRRAGFSLVEVLVAVFIVAAGLIALLTLFPLGAYQMANALRDDRSQQTCLQADGKVREMWRQRVTEVTPADPYFILADPYFSVLNYYDDTNGSAAPPGTQQPIGATRRVSYPVIFDPVGFYSYSGAKQTSAAGLSTLLRRPHPLFPGLIPSVRLASLTDDMEFGATYGYPADRDGVDVTTAGQNIFRAGRFNWAAVIQRPDNSNPLIADLKILVFDRRAPGVNPTAPNNELRYDINNVTAGTTIITLPDSNDNLGLRVGSWILDGTVGPDTNGDGVPDIRNANFYRLTAVDADSNPAQTTVELHVPIVRPRGEANPTNAYNARFYLFRELIDVYDRPQLVPNGYQKQTP